MEKIAIISDIHGNLDALESVLRDIDKEKCSKVFCLGDIAMAGPEPIQTIKKITQKHIFKDMVCSIRVRESIDLFRQVSINDACLFILRITERI